MGATDPDTILELGAYLYGHFGPEGLRGGPMPTKMTHLSG